MEKEIITPLEKNIIPQFKIISASSGCCGGTPDHNSNACCKLDEEKKAEGHEGCGCNSSGKKDSKNSCC